MKILRIAAAALVSVAALAGCGSSATFSGTPSSIIASAAPSAGAVTSADTPGQVCHLVNEKADRRCDPGVRNPLVTQLNIAATICKSGWTTTVRPTRNYTGKLKLEDMKRYGLPLPASLYEYDHIVSLQLGGDPKDPKNLYPEPYAGANGARAKDKEESTLNRAVCSGRMTLLAAQEKIVADWTA